MTEHLLLTDIFSRKDAVDSLTREKHKSVNKIATVH